MAQDNTPAVVMYKGAQEDGYSIPFDKGYYGEVKVAFVRRGLTDYEYMPTTYTVDGALYAWEISKGVYYYTKSASPIDGALVYDAGNHEISGVKVVSTQNASASFSDGKTGIRSNKKDIHSHALLFWTGEPLGDDDWICIVRDTVKKQPYSYPNNQKHIEGALDNLSRQIQELKAKSDVSLKIDPTFVQDPQKMNPIDWINTIVRSTDTTARGLRYRNFWLEYSTDDPNKAESDKSWTKLLNTTNVTTVRQLYDEEKNEYYFQYSTDGGASWRSVGLSQAEIDKILDEANAYSDEQNALLGSRINGKFTAVDAQIDANADAIQKTREDFINADSEIHQILNSHASELTTLRGNQASLGDQVSGIEEKIPESASGSNHLVTKQMLLDEEMDIRDDLNEMASELQTQITAQAAEIATKQDQLVAGDNITIVDNVISATGGGGGGDYLPLSGGHMTGAITFVDNVGIGTYPMDLGRPILGVGYVDNPYFLFDPQEDSFFPVLNGYTDLGKPNGKWRTVYANKLNNGANLTIPSEKGTLARIEDINAIGGDGTTGQVLTKTDTGMEWRDASGGGGGIANVVHDRTLKGNGTSDDPLGLSSETITRFEDIEKVIPGTANEDNKLCTYEEMQDNVQVVSDELTGLRESIQTKDLTVGTSEGTLNLSITAGVATIATNNGLDIVSQTKFDTAPTTDDATTWANANDTSLVTKRQVATALSESGDCGLIIRRL